MLAIIGGLSLSLHVSRPSAETSLPLHSDTGASLRLNDDDKQHGEYRKADQPNYSF